MATNTVSAVGILFYSVSTQRYLYLMRDDPKYPDTWGLPGGRIESGETIIAAMVRECEEELGGMPEFEKLAPIEKFTSADGNFTYHTFFCSVSNEFQPRLNDEHKGWAWIARGTWPKPMHPGLWSTVNLDTIQQKITVLEQSLA